MASGILSSLFGWISMVCWIFVYSPQLWENYTLQSGQGLSVLSVVIWLVGDLCSLTGGLIAQLIPSIIMLVAYYVICDCLLLLQIYYYRWKNSHIDEPITHPSEDFPLLESSIEPKSTKRWGTESEVVKCSLYLAFVFLAGISAWIIDLQIRGPRTPDEPEGVTDWKGQVLGWTGAVLFLSSRVSQMIRNVETRCEGLSPVLFLFAITGNCTYSLSICFASMEKQYLLANAPWLTGCILTVFFDLFIIGQFVYYRSGKQRRIQL